MYAIMHMSVVMCRVVRGVMDHGVKAGLQHVNAVGWLRYSRGLLALLHTHCGHPAVHGGPFSLPTHSPSALVSWAHDCVVYLACPVL